MIASPLTHPLCYTPLWLPSLNIISWDLLHPGSQTGQLSQERLSWEPGDLHLYPNSLKEGQVSHFTSWSLRFLTCRTGTL